MNPMLHLLRCSGALLLTAAALHAQPSSFTAGHGEWFDDLNWSAGSYPDGTTDATLDGAAVRRCGCTRGVWPRR